MKALLIVAKVAASLALLWLVLRSIDLAAVGRSMRSLDVGTFALATLTMIAASVMSGLRWHGLLTALGARVSVRRAIELTFVCQFFNSALPSNVGGDAARIIYAVRGGQNLPLVTTATLLDRAAGGLTLVAMSLAILALHPYNIAFPASWRWSVVAGLALVLIGAAAVALLLVLVRDDRLPFHDTRWFRHTIESLANARLHPLAVVAALAWSATIFVMMAVLLGLCARSIAVPLDFGHALVLVAPVAVASALPISLAGWGVREITVVQLFDLVGLSPESGLTTSVLFGFAFLLDGLVGLVIWLSLRTEKPVTAAP